MQNTFIDLTNQSFGDWTAKRYVGDSMWECECKCGEMKIIHRYSLLHRAPMYCNHNKYKIDDNIDDNHTLLKGSKFGLYLGKKFGEWEVVGDIDSKYKVPCRCSCGKLRSVNFYSLRDGRSTGCGHTMNQDRVEDLTGRVFGDLTVVRYLGNQYWECKCSCENLCKKHRTHLLDGRAHSCGHETNKVPEDLTKQSFGKLTPIKYIGSKQWLCRCECGNTKVISSANLKNHSTISCGCVNYTPTKEELLNLINTYISKNDRKPAVKELAIMAEVSDTSMRYHLSKFGLNNSSYIDVKFSSSGEREVWEYVRTLYSGTMLHNTRDVIPGYELDIYLPDKNLALEFNGTYWHSSINKDRNYHQNKTLACMSKGIHLIHIFEYEWINQEISQKIKNYIKSIITDEYIKVYARDTDVTEIDSKIAYDFVSKYHMQGALSSPINIGIYYKSELLGVMTLGNSRFDNNFEYEIHRLIFKDSIHIIGGASKMFQYFIRKYNPKSVLSYCDASKFTGEVYKNMGFKLSNPVLTEPNYVWVGSHSNEVWSRAQSRKSRLIELGLGDASQTEDDIMISNGYYKVFNSGNFKFEYKQN